MEETEIDKHSCIFSFRINYDFKKFYGTGHTSFLLNGKEKVL